MCCSWATYENLLPEANNQVKEWINLFSKQCVVCYVGRLDHPEGLLTRHRKMKILGFPRVVWTAGSVWVLFQGSHHQTNPQKLCSKLLHSIETAFCIDVKFFNVIPHWFMTSWSLAIKICFLKQTIKWKSDSIYFSNREKMISFYRCCFYVCPLLANYYLIFHHSSWNPGKQP